MKRIEHSIIFIVMFFAFSHTVFANVEITEIMHNPNISGGDYDWIEVYNNDSAPVDLTNYYFYSDSNGISASSTRHGITGDNVLDPNKYAIISSDSIDNFKSKYNFSGVVFHSSFNISSTIETTLIITSDTLKPPSNDKIDSEVICDPSLGGDNNGQSLQLIDGVWKESTSTIGKVNIVSSSIEEQNILDQTDTSSSLASKSSSFKVEQKVYKIATKIISPKIATAGIPFVVDHQTTGTKNEKVILGKFVWNFGDGNSKESSTSNPFEYTYQYGGDYVLTLSFYDSILKNKPDAVDRINIKVISSGLVVSSVGTQNDPFIEIENKSSYEINLFNFIIKGSNHSFSIPAGTIILPNKKLKISPKITGFDSSDLSFISIVDKDGQIFATYPSRAYSNLRYSNNKNLGGIVKSESVTNDQIEDSPEVVNLNDLGANASNASDDLVLSKGLYPWFGLASIIFLGILSVIFIRKKHDYPDYIDSEISAKDMTIIE